MAYNTSTSIASVANLIDTLATFASAAGWTVERNTLSGANRTLTLKRAETDYIHVYNVTPGQLLLRASTGYDGALAPPAQPGATPQDAVTARLTGPYPKVWFFADGTEVAVVVRRGDQNGAYASFAFGAIQKYGTFDGGTFVDGTYFDRSGSNSGAWTGNDHGLLAYGSSGAGYVRADADGVSDQWMRLSGAEALAQSGPPNAANMYSANQAGSCFSVARLLGAADDNTFSGRSLLYPIELSIRRAGSPTYYSPIGYVDSIRAISLAKFSPEDELSIASETWAVFPIVNKRDFSGTSGAPHASGNVGIAIRKVP